MEVCNVAYALTAKKLRKGGISFTSSPGAVGNWHGGGLADLLCANDAIESGSPPEGGVRFFPFCAEATERAPEFHLIIHKLTDMDAEESRLKLAAIERYLAAHSRTSIIDPLSSVSKITSRWRACECLQRILERGGGAVPFKQPAYCLVESVDQFTGQMTKHALQFPVICKPLHACGTPESHKMVVLVSAADVTTELCPFPCLVQQYRNHGGTFLKVYVLGGQVHVYRRTSLPDLDVGRDRIGDGGSEKDAHEVQEQEREGEELTGRPRSSTTCSVVFDSRCCYPTLEDFLSGPAVTDLSHVKKADREVPPTSMPPVQAPIPAAVVARCEEAAAVIGRDFNLSLFGFDVIVPTDSSPSGAAPADWEAYVIDVNFFPSYKELVDFPQRLRSFLRAFAGLPPWPDAAADGDGDPISPSLGAANRSPPTSFMQT